MSVGLDTSVVLRLLTGVPRGQAEVAATLLEEAGAPVNISDLVIGETYFALRHHYAVPHAGAIRAMSGLLADARVTSSGVARGVLAEPAARSSVRSWPGLIDLLIHADYARDAVDLITFDRDLGRLQGVRLLSA